MSDVIINKMKIDFTYLAQPPKRYTFQQPKLKEWTEKWCKGKVLNLFAGITKLNVDEFRVDMDKDVPADWYGDAFEFVKTTKLRFDTIVLDPPYNLRKSREKYGSRYIGSFTKIKNELSRILNCGGLIIHYGYDSVGMSKCRGFEKIAICLVCHNGDHNDTICLVERKVRNHGMKYSKNPEPTMGSEKDGCPVIVRDRYRLKENVAEDIKWKKLKKPHFKEMK